MIREDTPIKFKANFRAKSPAIVSTNDHLAYNDLIILRGSPLSVKRRKNTPGFIRSRPKRLITKLPFVKWAN
jgi:hypothetical protein